jgi:hypothetical protein
MEESSNAVTYQNHSEFFTKDIVNKKEFSIMTLATQITALHHMDAFVGRGITMNSGDKRPDGTDKTSFEKKVEAYSKTKPLVARASESIDKAITAVYNERKTSNLFLYKIIEKTKLGSWDTTLTGNAKKKEEQEQEAFSRIYKKFILGEPLSVDIFEIQSCLYTGVDKLLKSTDKSGLETKEICVYLNVLDDQNARKTKSAQCIQRDDSLTNLLKYLLYFNTDEPLNTFRDFRLNAPYVEKDTDKPKDAKNDQTKGGTRRRHKKRRDTRGRKHPK